MVDKWTDTKEEDLFISAFQFSTTGMAVVSADGYFVRVNPALCRILGYVEEELTGKHITEVTHPEDVEYSMTFMSTMLGGAHAFYHFEKRYVHRSGDPVWALVSASLVETQPEISRYFFTQVQDITERKKAEAAADSSYKQMIQTLESISDGFFSLDAHGLFTYVNKAAEAFVNRTRDELLGNHIREVFPELWNMKIQHYYMRWSQRPEPDIFEEYYPPLDKWFEFHTHPSADAFSVYFRDITDRKKAEAALRESEELYRMMAEHSTDILSKHDMSGCYLYVSLACRTLLGYEQDELLGRTVYEFLHPDDVGIIRQIERHLQEHPNMSLPSYRIRKKNGEYVWFETTGRVILNGSNGNKELLCVSRDISVRKTAEQELMQTNERLQKISTMDALTGLANRRLFDESFEKEWKNGVRFQSPLSVILLDIDYFKRYNDTYGHHEGDLCLQRVAQTLRSVVKRPSDIVARYGGEEFVIMLPITDQRGADVVAEQLRAEVDKLGLPNERSDVSPCVTVSLGTATIVPSRDISPKELLIRADKALYQAKHDGRNRVNVFTAD